MIEIHVYEQMQTVPDEIQALWQHGKGGQNEAQPDFDSSYEWYKELLLSALKPGASPIIITAQENGNIVILPLQIYYRKFKRYIGALTTVYSHNYLPIVIGEQTNCHKLIQSCMKHAIENFQPFIIDLEPLDPSNKLIKPLFQEINSWMITDTYFRFGNWIHTDIQSFEQYKNSLQSQLKNTIERRQKKLDKNHVWEIKVYTKIDEIEPAYEEYKYLYKLRWKKDEGNKQFFDAIVLDMAEKENIRLGILYIDNKPAAAQIWFSINKTASIFKLAYDEKYKQFSPGTLLTYKLAEYCITQDKVNKLDFLSGDDYYKRQWMNKRDEKWGIIAFNQRSAYGIFAAFRHYCGKFARYLKSIPSKKAG